MTAKRLNTLLEKLGACHEAVPDAAAAAYAAEKSDAKQMADIVRKLIPTPYGGK